MVYYEKNEMPGSDQSISEDDASVQDASVQDDAAEIVAESAEFKDTSLDPEEDGLTDEEKERRLAVRERVALVHGGGKKARAFQRKQTREMATLDLIVETNEMLSQLMRVANLGPDLVKLLFTITKKKDQELVRLRRELIHTQNALNGNMKHLVPRLVCKAQQASYMSESVKSLKKALENRPRGKIAVSSSNRSDGSWESQERSD